MLTVDGIQAMLGSNTTTPDTTAKPLTIDSGLHWNISGLKIHDLASKALIYRSAESTFDFSNAAAQMRNRSIRMQSHVADAHYTREANATVKRMVADIGNSLALKNLDAKILDVSEYGRLDQDLDLTYEGPVDAAGLTVKPVVYRFDLNRFETKNALYRGTLAIHAASDGTKSKDGISMHGRFDADKRFDQLMLARAETPAARSLVPQLHELSPLKVDVDASGNFGDAVARAPESAVKIQTAGISAKPYGLELHGEYWHRGDLQYSDFKLTCRDCDRLLNDLEGQARGLQANTPNIPQSLSAHLNSNQFESTRLLLHRIADVPGKRNDTLVLHFEKAPDGEPTINGRSIIEVMMLMQAP